LVSTKTVAASTRIARLKSSVKVGCHNESLWKSVEIAAGRRGIRRERTSSGLKGGGSRESRPSKTAKTGAASVGMVSARSGGTASRQESSSSRAFVQAEIYIDFDRPVTNRVAIFHCWTEAPLLDRFGCLFIQAHSQLADHSDVAGRAIGLDNET
jgi:hypothetical protein